jgi:integrase
VNREKSCLSAVFTAAVEWRIVKENPCRQVPKIEEPPRDRYVTDAEFTAVYRLASPTLQCAMDRATLTGQREGDLLGLSRSQLTDEGIVFRTGKSKRRHPRHGKMVETAKTVIVEWSPELRAVIERLKKLGPGYSGDLDLQPAGQALFRVRIPRELAVKRRSPKRPSPSRLRFTTCEPRAPATKRTRARPPNASRTTIHELPERCACGSRVERVQARKY